MPRGTDLTTTLNAAELARVRSMLAQQPPEETDPALLAAFPRMLYHETYLENQAQWKTETDETKKKVFHSRMGMAIQVVHDVDELHEYLLDGWKESPADFLPPDKDPRVPIGREARKAEAQRAMSVQDEIAMLTARLAALQAAVDSRPAQPVSDQPKRSHHKKPAPAPVLPALPVDDDAATTGAQP
jgi:hypothetical protein